MELPEWVKEKTNIRIVAGNEVVARKIGDSPWMIKTHRCARCGMCCLYGNYGFEYLDPKDCGDGSCEYIGIEYVGGQHLYKCDHPEQPWSCVRGTGEDVHGCSIRYKEWR